MEVVSRHQIRRRVLDYLKREPSPVGLSSIAEHVRSDTGFSQVRDSEVRNVVQSMIVTGKLNYAPGLKIELRSAAADNL